MRHLLQATELDRTEIETLFARADQIARGNPARLNSKRVALALLNPLNPLPVDARAILTDAGAVMLPIAPRSNQAGDVIQAIRQAKPEIALLSFPQNGMPSEIAQAARIPILNAGDGTNENPARALMDAYAIHTLKRDWQTIRITLLGNLKFSAEAHSLVQLLGNFGVRLSLVSPAALSMPYDVTDLVRASAYEVEETNDLVTTLRKTDVLYLSRIDPMRVEKKSYDKLKDFYRLSDGTLAEAKDGIVILGDWEGADALLAPARPVVERSARAMLLALVEWAIVSSGQSIR